MEEKVKLESLKKAFSPLDVLPFLLLLKSNSDHQFLFFFDKKKLFDVKVSTLTSKFDIKGVKL